MPVLDDHPSIPKAPADDQIIWRFLTLEKLLHMILNGSLYFTQVLELQKDDPFESQFSSAHIIAIKTIMSDVEALKAFLRYANKTEEIDLNDDRIKNQINMALNIPMLEMFAKFAAGIHYVNCWHVNDFESAAMWRLYCSNHSGVAIKSTVGKLKKSIEDNESDIYIGKIEYIDYRTEVIPTGNSFNTIFRKRLSFAHENELRVCLVQLPERLEGEENSAVYSFLDRNPKGIHLKCKMTELIDEVVVSPLSQAWFTETIKGVLESLVPGLNVKKSDLFDPPNYAI